MSEPVTARELEAMRVEMREGFRGINSRLDALNGQTRRHGEAIAAHRVLHEQHATRFDSGDAKFDELIAAGATLRLMVEQATTRAVQAAVPVAVDEAVPPAAKAAMRGSAKWVPIGATAGSFVASFLWQLAVHWFTK